MILGTIFGRLKTPENSRIFGIFKDLGTRSVGLLEARPTKMCVYTAESPSVWWSQITSSDSNHFIIDAIQPGIDILDETGVIRVLERRQGPLFFLWANVFFVNQTVSQTSFSATRSRIPVSSDPQEPDFSIARI